MKGLLSVMVVLALCVAAVPAEAGCFVNQAQASYATPVQVFAQPTADSPGSSPASPAPCGVGLNPYAAAAFNPYGFNAHVTANPYAAVGYHNVDLLRQRFINGRLFQPVLVLKQVKQVQHQPVVVRQVVKQQVVKQDVNKPLLAAKAPVRRVLAAAARLLR